MTSPQLDVPPAFSNSHVTTRDSSEQSALLRNIYVCYFLSGALGLVYQILWLRKLLLTFGSTVHAVSTILTVFFGGLALGSWYFGRRIDRREDAGLRWYAALEIGVGLYAFMTLPLFDAIRHIYIPLYRASDFSPVALVGWSFVCSCAILGFPTFLLGGTFPVLSRFLIRSREGRGVTIATLYGINTAGAMIGTLVVYYVGLPVLGLWRTLVCAGVLNLGIGMLCLAFDRHLASLGFQGQRREESPDPMVVGSDRPDESGGLVRWVLGAFALSGFSAMVYEVAWTRTLSLVLGSSIYAFCLMLATFLGGMALGSLVARRTLRARPAHIGQFIFIELVLGFYGVCSILLFSELPQWFVQLWPMTGGSFAMVAWLQVGLSAAVMLLPTFVLGWLFPIVSDFVTQRITRLGEQIGRAYALNTVGGILGSFLSGFVLIPLCGLPWAIMIAALVNLIAAGIVSARLGEAKTRVPRLAGAIAGVIAVGLVGKFIIIPVWQQQAFAAGVYLNPEAYEHASVQQSVSQAKLLYYRDSLNATVSVHQQGNLLFLKVGGKTDASNGMDMGTQALSAHIPMLLHKNPKQVLVIGLGSGVTLGHASRYPVSTLHCAEIDPAVIEGARYFRAYNYGVHDDPRTRIFPVDGRNFLMASQTRYDVIISEPSNPWMAGLGYLFTEEFYGLAKQRLAPGGVMCQWLQLYRMFPGDVKLLLKTFHHTFPYVSVWSSIPGDLLMVGSMEPQAFDYAQLTQRMADPAVRDALHAVQIDRPDVLLQLFLFGSKEVEQITSDIGWLHQDDQPWVEFSAPKAMYANPSFSINYKGLEQFKGDPHDIAPAYRPTGDAAFYEALGSLWNAREERERAREAWEHALTIDPTSRRALAGLSELYVALQQPLNAQAMLTKAVAIAPQSDTYRALGKLYWRQQQLDAAQQAYEHAARLQPPDAQFAEEMGYFMRQRQQFLWAAEYFRSALAQGSGEQPEVMAVYAQVLKELAQPVAMEQVLRVGMNRFAHEATFPLLLGDLLLEQKRGREAQPLFERALALAPKRVRAYYGLARLAVAEGRAEEAIRYLKTGLQYQPYDRELLQLLHQVET